MSQKILEKELFDELHRLTKELGRPPKKEEIQKFGKYSPNAYKRFGGILKACEMTGLEPRRFLNLTKDDCLKEIVKIYNQLKKIPTTDDFSVLSKITYNTLRNITKNQSWQSLLEESGVFDIENEKKQNIKTIILEDIKINNEIVKKASGNKDISPICYNGQSITKQYLENCTDEQKQEILNFAVEYFTESGFPYPQFLNDELQDDWKKLCEFDTLQIIKSNVIFDSKVIQSKLWRHFTKAIYKTRTKSKLSMIDCFQNKMLLRKCLSNRMGITYDETFNITPAMLRQGFRNAFISANISIFKPAIAKLIYDKYTKINDIVYDFSVGFGQRLLGAMSCKNDLTYIGCDPWLDCIDSANEITQFINKQDKIYLENIGSEIFCSEQYTGKINLAFSSPPYFKTEIYDNGNETQAGSKDYDYYINIWWNKTINNIEKLLTNNGLLIINIPQIIFKDLPLKNFELIETLYISLSRNQTFNPEKVEPIYVLRKNNNGN